ncbi:cobalt-precorrin-6Y C(15)-methyltransferase [Methanocella sp. CWC-04]|uniref:Cobalt-precorrin-6Y C(15)-methyltransferase n=1 Tax=Methanooceanicella nereidis TaxID=2052831 RepID=A0AAP2RDN5_9EURY|nr:methyltransferase domain-containing protein [Methanocella sp. CWC-04]MCD1295403.1 cobalt-precorrin-6Y C(15)-methyltransferase [Methanocella sp. CWC-04]
MKLKGGPTQDEIMAISLYKLGLKKGDVFADIGCGTGKVSIDASKLANKVYAIDRRDEAIEYAKTLAASSGAAGIEFLKGNALEFLGPIECLDCAFVGGSKDLEKVLELLSAKVKGNIVVNAVMPDTLKTAVDTMRRLGIFKEAINVQVSRSYDIAGGFMFKPIDPVYIIVGGRR